MIDRLDESERGEIGRKGMVEPLRERERERERERLDIPGSKPSIPS